MKYMIEIKNHNGSSEDVLANIKAALAHADNTKEYRVTVDDMSDKIAIIWCTEDVIERAKDNDIEVTEEEALGILSEMDSNHDCNIGITWDTIDYYVDNLKS